MISTNYADTSARQSLAGGGLKPRRSPLRIELRATVSCEVCGYGLLAHARIQWWQRPELGWLVAAAASWAAVSATVSSNAKLRGRSYDGDMAGGGELRA